MKKTKCDRCGELTDNVKHGHSGYEMHLCPACAADWYFISEDMPEDAKLSFDEWKKYYQEFCVIPRGGNAKIE